jgi:DNA-binding Xre family transcriptional regulator
MIYSNLKAEMVLRRISTEELAKKLLISRFSLEKKLNGDKDFNLNEIEIILKIFNNCAFEYLFQLK